MTSQRTPGQLDNSAAFRAHERRSFGTNLRGGKNIFHRSLPGSEEQHRRAQGTTPCPQIPRATVLALPSASRSTNGSGRGEVPARCRNLLAPSSYTLPTAFDSAMPSALSFGASVRLTKMIQQDGFDYSTIQDEKMHQDEQFLRSTKLDVERWTLASKFKGS